MKRLLFFLFFFITTQVSAQQSPVMRIGTYNVNSEQKCEGKVDLQKLRMNRLADVIIQQNIDIISLQEMEDWRMDKSSGTHVMKWPDQIYDALYLQQELQRRGYSMALFDSFSQPQSGLRVVTLSRYPAVPGTHEIFLITGGGGSRHSHLVQLTTPLGPVWFVSIHTRYQNAKEHIAFLNEMLKDRFSSEKKVIVAGDFNASAGGDAMEDHVAMYQVVGGAGTLTDKITVPKSGDITGVSSLMAGDPADNVCPNATTDSHGVVVASVKLKDGVPIPPPAPTITPPPAVATPTVTAAPVAPITPTLSPLLTQSTQNAPIATASAHTKSTGYVPLWMYVWISIVYVVIMQHALQIRTQFNRFFMYGAFVFGGILGYFFSNYLFGFFVAIILSLILW